MRDGVMEQAVYGATEAGVPGVLARSPGFRDDWVPIAERLAANFGERPEGVVCPACVFAQPFGDRHVAIVQAADQGRPGPPVFRFLVLPEGLYDRLGGDPFHIADQNPPDWRARGDVPALEAPAAPPKRTAEELQKVLNVPHSATLLGGVQALLDGKPLVFERTAPDSHLIRSLWALLPTDRRSGLWPAEFAFGNGCRFDAVAVPRAAGPDFEGCLTEEQAGDYPEGAYERRLQSAVEAGDQRRLDDLLAGRMPGKWVRVAFLLCALVILNVPFAMMFLKPPPVTPPHLPAAESCPPLDDGQRQALADRLHQFAQAHAIDLPAGTTDAALADGIERIDEALPVADPARDPVRLRDLGPVQRQLRALLWKHGVADYDAPGLEPAQMVQKLQEQLGPTR